MATTNTSRFSWTGIDPTEWMRVWQTLCRGLPENLVQPILRGWTFPVNSNNSTAPQTEADVVARYSYGREIGRMSEALELLIEERHGKTPRYSTRDLACAKRLLFLFIDRALEASTGQVPFRPHLG